MAAAGKSHLAEQFYEGAAPMRVASAGELQALLKPTGDTGFRDVLHSLAAFDIHPPLYFFALRAMQVSGIDSQTLLRLFGTLIALLTAWIADRWVWPDAPPIARLLGAVWLIASPTCLEVATQLRQYSLVYLGVMLGLAGLLRLHRPDNCDWRNILLVASGPVVLLYSQFGTAPWIALMLLASIMVAWRSDSSARRLLGYAVILSGVALSPVLAWWLFKTSALGPSPQIASSRWWADAISPVAESLGFAWISFPARWKVAAVGASLALIIALGSGCIADRADRIIGITSLAWTVIWLVLLAMGKAPPHAVTAKYLAPLVLGMLVLIVRGTKSSKGIGRGIAWIVLIASTATHGIGIRQALQRSTSSPLTQALAQTDCLLVNIPRRGYLLPLSMAMRPDARIIVVEASEALEKWKTLEALLPPDGVLLAEIWQSQPVQSAELHQRLQEKYRSREVLRSEPARTITDFRKPRVTRPER
jgi:uncharacterized membrane protein